jgi:hypothetical protein
MAVVLSRKTKKLLSENCSISAGPKLLVNVSSSKKRI